MQMLFWQSGQVQVRACIMRIASSMLGGAAPPPSPPMPAAMRGSSVPAST